MKVVGTVTDCVQVGIDSFQNRSYSKIFTMKSTLQDIDDWGKHMFPSAVSGFERVALSIAVEEAHDE